MQITGVTLEQFNTVVSHVSENLYDSNLDTPRTNHPLSSNRIRARVTVTSSSAPGARRTRDGRKLAAACWHVYRDVLTELFEQHPSAVVRTSLATYRGKPGFHDTFPDTAYANIGSQLFPYYISEACECQH